MEHRMVAFGEKAAANEEGMVVCRVTAPDLAVNVVDMGVTAEDLAVNVVDMEVIEVDMVVIEVDMVAIEVVLVAIEVVRVAAVERHGGRKQICVNTTADSRVDKRSGRNAIRKIKLSNGRSATVVRHRSGSINAKLVKGEERPSRVHQAPARSRLSMAHNQGRNWVAVHRQERASTVRK